MFSKANNSDFNIRGNLKSRITYLWTGEASMLTARRVVLLDSESKEEKESFSLEIVDCFGFSQSLWSRNFNREDIADMISQIPYGITFMVEGDVAVRKGRTYFNVKKLVFPDGSPVLASPGEKGEEENDPF